MKSALLASSASDWLVQLILYGPLGILGPILLVLLCLWLGRGDRSPWFVKAIFLALLVLLLLILFGPSLTEGEPL